MSELGLLLSDMVCCVACGDDLTDDSVETPEGEMCRSCAAEHDHGALEVEMCPYGCVEPCDDCYPPDGGRR